MGTLRGKTRIRLRPCTLKRENRFRDIDHSKIAFTIYGKVRSIVFFIYDIHSAMPDIKHLVKGQGTTNKKDLSKHVNVIYMRAIVRADR